MLVCCEPVSLFSSCHYFETVFISLGVFVMAHVWYLWSLTLPVHALRLTCMKTVSRWTQNDIDGKGKLDSRSVILRNLVFSCYVSIFVSF